MTKHDLDFLSRVKESLFSAVLGDVMDQMGLLHQFLPPGIQPLLPDMVVVGRAMPVLVADLGEDERHRHQEKPFGLMLEALDDLKSGEVYLASGNMEPYALWGELMTIRAKKLSAAGVVLNGFSRDTPGVLAQDFPVFCMGRYAQDQGPRGTVVDFRVKIRIGQVLVHPGDLIFGDIDGVCVVPADMETEVISRALEKVSGEKLVQKALEQGSSAVDAFNTYGIM